MKVKTVLGAKRSYPGVPIQERVHQLADSFFECAKLNLKRDKTLVPAVFLIFPNGEVRVIGCRFGSPEDKAAIMRCLSQRALEEGASALIFIGEAWSWKEGDSSRGECVTMVVTQRGFPRWAAYQPFVRKGDRILFLEREEDKAEPECTLIPRWEK